MLNGLSHSLRIPVCSWGQQQRAENIVGFRGLVTKLGWSAEWRFSGIHDKYANTALPFQPLFVRLAILANDKGLTISTTRKIAP